MVPLPAASPASLSSPSHSRVGAMGACTHSPPDCSLTMVMRMLVVTLLPPRLCGCSKPHITPRTNSLRMVGRLRKGPSGKGYPVTFRYSWSEARGAAGEAAAAAAASRAWRRVPAAPWVPSRCVPVAAALAALPAVRGCGAAFCFCTAAAGAATRCVATALCVPAFCVPIVPAAVLLPNRLKPRAPVVPVPVFWEPSDLLLLLLPLPPSAPNRLNRRVPVVPALSAAAAGLPAVRGAGTGLNFLSTAGGAGRALGEGAGLADACLGPALAGAGCGLALGVGPGLMGRPLASTAESSSFLRPSLKMLQPRAIWKGWPKGLLSLPCGVPAPRRPCCCSASLPAGEAMHVVIVSTVTSRAPGHHQLPPGRPARASGRRRKRRLAQRTTAAQHCSRHFSRSTNEAMVDRRGGKGERQTTPKGAKALRCCSKESQVTCCAVAEGFKRYQEACQCVPAWRVGGAAQRDDVASAARTQCSRLRWVCITYFALAKRGPRACNALSCADALLFPWQWPGWRARQHGTRKLSAIIFPDSHQALSPSWPS